MATPTFKEPWPEKGIEHYSCIEDGEWGYLQKYPGSDIEFNTNERPSDKEILDRWWIYFGEQNDRQGQ